MKIQHHDSLKSVTSGLNSTDQYDEMMLNRLSLNNEDKNISLDSSIISDISQGSKNFIRKDMLFKESPNIPTTTTNNEIIVAEKFTPVHHDLNK